MKTLVSALAVASLAGSAFGISATSELTRSGTLPARPATVDRVNWLGDITQYVTITEERDVVDRGVGVYDTTTPTSYATLTSSPASPAIGFNDYQTSLHPGPNGDASDIAPLAGLERMIWVGGSAATGGGPNGKVDFFFLWNDGSTATGFTITFAAATFAKWNIELNIPGGIAVPEEGFLFVQKNATSPVEMRMGLQTSAPTIGTEDSSVAGWADGLGGFWGPNASKNFISGASNYREGFRLEIPAPGAAALMGLAGLVGLRRRR